MFNTHITGTRFLPLGFTSLLLICIHAFLEKNLFTSEIFDIYHKCPLGIVIYSLSVSGSLVSVEIDVLYAHWILSFLCSAVIVIILVSLVILYFPSMIGSLVFVIVEEVSNFFNALNRQSYADLYVSVS